MIIFGILLHVIVKMEIYTNIVVDSAITCDEIIVSYEEETKTILTSFNENNLQNAKKIHFSYSFVNYYRTVSIFCYLIKY